MKFKRLSISYLTCLLVAAHSQSAWAIGPCHDRRQAKQNAQKELHACLMAWTKDVKPETASPSDDCAARLSAFVQSSKDLKACWAEQKTKRDAARTQKQ